MHHLQSRHIRKHVGISPSTANERGDCLIFYAYQSAQVFATTSADTFASLSTSEWLDHHGIQRRHSLGGTIWHIQHGLESVVYAVDWNQGRENVFSGAAWLGESGAGGATVIEQLRKPTALVCSARGVEKIALPGGHAKRDELMVDMIASAIAGGGTVLIPTDSSARVLELAYMLDHAWSRHEDASESPLKGARLYLASRTIGATMRYARSMIEWMDDGVVREFEAAGNTQAQQNHRTNIRSAADHHADHAPGVGPFDFKYLKLLEKRSQIDKLLSLEAPKVILASDATISWGFSKHVLQHIAHNKANLVILTEPPSREQAIQGRSMIHTLWQWYQEKRDGVAVEIGKGGQSLMQVFSGERALVFADPKTTLLEGRELALYQQHLAAQRQLQNIDFPDPLALEASADAGDDASSTSSSSTEESDHERQGRALNFSSALAQSTRTKEGLGKELVGVNMLLRKPGVYDWDVRGKKGRETMFPHSTKRRRGDDFGEVIRPEDYLRAEEREEADAQDRELERSKDAALGQKRKWQDPASPDGGQSNILTNGKKKRRLDGHAALDASGISQTANGIHDDELEDLTDEEPESALGPSKLEYTTTSVPADLRIAYVDFSGLHDQRSLYLLIPLVQPRKVVLVGGSEAETAMLAQECRSKLRKEADAADGGFVDNVFTPAVGETVSASIDTHAWTVKLSDALVRKIHWQNVKGLGVATLMGQVAAGASAESAHSAEGVRRKRQKMLKEETTDVTDVALSGDGPLPTLDVLPASMTSATRSVAQPLHVGDLRLADLRRLLLAGGHAAEFRGQGTLVIDSFVAVRKSGSGKIQIEGGGFRASDYPSEASFHAVKRKIYEGLAIIAGG